MDIGIVVGVREERVVSVERERQKPKDDGR